MTVYVKHSLITDKMWKVSVMLESTHKTCFAICVIPMQVLNEMHFVRMEVMSAKSTHNARFTKLSLLTSSLIFLGCSKDVPILTDDDLFLYQLRFSNFHFESDQ